MSVCVRTGEEEKIIGGTTGCMNFSRRFQRFVETFVCEHCGITIQGDGYTNHCWKCLWSRHVDINPGDRLEQCGGMMEPVGYEAQSGKKLLIHRCIRCGTIRRNRRQENDNFEAILALVESVSLRGS
jgi:hypothetical protein